jgi:hypothetical protein
MARLGGIMPIELPYEAMGYAHALPDSRADARFAASIRI